MLGWSKKLQREKEEAEEERKEGGDGVLTSMM